MKDNYLHSALPLHLSRDSNHSQQRIGSNNICRSPWRTQLLEIICCSTITLRLVSRCYSQTAFWKHREHIGCLQGVSSQLMKDNTHTAPHTVLSHPPISQEHTPHRNRASARTASNANGQDSIGKRWSPGWCQHWRKVETRVFWRKRMMNLWRTHIHMINT